MQGNRIRYELVRTSLGVEIPSRVSVVDDFTWFCAYKHGYREARFAVPALPRNTSLCTWAFVTFEQTERYDHVSRTWEVDTTVTVLQILRCDREE